VSAPDTARAAVRVVAPGKVNLGLRVAARRGDGFHEIDTVFAALDVGDLLRVERSAEDGVAGAVLDERGTAGGDLPGMDPGNLAWRAADAWLRESGAPGGGRIELRKRLPVAAGLGGGSSDAATVLRALGALEPERAVDPVRLGARLGSDVPFFAAGVASARGRGRGERLRTFDLPPRWLVLVNPGVPVPVAHAYARLGGFGPPVDWEALANAWRAGEAPRWRNDLQTGVFADEPEVRAAWRALADAELAAPLLSGSGGTCFALAPDEDGAHRAAAWIAAQRPGWWVRAARAPFAPAPPAPAPPAAA
jgi:4-diphosphocytidyl-2-C-methyl-D-erythritol kinase